MCRCGAVVHTANAPRPRKRRRAYALQICSAQAAGGATFARSLRMQDRIVIEVDGIDDLTLVDAIERTVRASFRERTLPGPWRIRIRRSNIGGRWDLTVYGEDQRHTLSIAVPAALLPDLIPVRLRESLERLCAAARTHATNADALSIRDAVSA